MNRRCPINSIKFVPVKEHKRLENRKKKDDKYLEVDFNDQWKIAYSKSEARIPFTNFKVDQETPCMDRF